MLTHVDLFSGIGGMALAAQWAGFETVAFCEKDKWCQTILKQHWSEVPIYEDVRDFPRGDYRGATLLTGGFPCQPFSHCGKRRGKTDDRYLWPAMLEVVKDIKPSWVVVENVSNFAKMEVKTVVADMEKIGFECVVLLLPAHGVGAPHRRRRTFIVAKSLDTNSNCIGLYREKMHQNRQGGCSEFRHQQIGIPGSMVQEQIWKGVDSRVLRMDNGVSNRMDQEDRKARIKALGNAVVPQLVYELLIPISELESGELYAEDFREKHEDHGSKTQDNGISQIMQTSS